MAKWPDDYNLEVQLSPEAYTLFQQSWTGQGDPLYAALSRYDGSNSLLVSEEELDRLREVAGEILDAEDADEDDVIVASEFVEANDFGEAGAPSANPPSWVTDEATWERAKQAAAKSGVQDRWALTTYIYKKMKGMNPGEGRHPALKDGIHVEWSAPNQAWFVMWNETVLRVISDRAELEDYLKHDLKVDVAIPRGREKRRGKNPTQTRWTPAMLAELSNLFHLSATALARSGGGPTRHERRLWASKEYSKAHPEVCSTAAYKQLCREEAWRYSSKNPAELPPPSPKVIENYEVFHEHPPSNVLEIPRAWVPGPLVQVGNADTVNYCVTTKKSVKQGPYYHLHGKGVKVYRPAEKGERSDMTWRHFPLYLQVIGYFDGLVYKDASGEAWEVPGSKKYRLATTPDRKALIVVGPEGVDFVIKGGRLRVDDWIRD